MWWPGRGNSGGSWLPEKTKVNMWHGKGNSGGSWPPAFPRSSGSSSAGFEHFPQTLIIQSLYFCNLEVKTFDFGFCRFFKYQSPQTSHCKYIRIRKLEFEGSVQLFLFVRPFINVRHF